MVDERLSLIGNSWCVFVIAWLVSGVTGLAQVMLYAFTVCLSVPFSFAACKEPSRTYRHNFICDWCWASKKNTALNFANFKSASCPEDCLIPSFHKFHKWLFQVQPLSSEDAMWRSTVCATTEPESSPWCKVHGFSRIRQLWDCSWTWFKNTFDRKVFGCDFLCQL